MHLKRRWRATAMPILVAIVRENLMIDKPNGGPRDVTRQLGYMLRLAQANMWQDLINTFEPFGIKPQQYAALVLIEASSGLRLERLAQQLAIRPQNLVAFVENLVGRGLIERRKFANDRRVNALFLTETGIGLLQQLKAADDRHEQALIEMFGAERLHGLVEDLDRLAGFSSVEDKVRFARHT
jgi:DNA-binding MarR family transcriptional regulator